MAAILFWRQVRRYNNFMSDPKPTIDQRLDAIAESLQLLTADVHELQILTRENTANIASLTADVASLTRITSDVVDIVKTHEHRLNRIQGLT